MGQIYKTPKASNQRPGKTNAEIFRSNLYKYGKAAGTARVVPGIAGTNIANGYIWAPSRQNTQTC